jgi:hypothetical protein
MEYFLDLDLRYPKGRFNNTANTNSPTSLDNDSIGDKIAIT